MNRTQLATALRDTSERLRAREAQDEDNHDALELLRVLARIVEGKPLALAFGAPGDWGYGTPIGDALAADDPEAVTVKGMDLLTAREADIFRLLAGGANHREAGKALGISPKTVAVHLSNCRYKLGGGTLIQMAARHGLAPVPS